MHRYNHRMFRCFFFGGVVVAFAVLLQAQELTDKQRILAGRYAQLEQILLRLAETSGNSNPQQSALLKKALLESKDKLLVQRFDTLINILERSRLSDAVTSQTEIEQDLLLLLKILENALREDKRNQEKEKIKELLKDLEEILQSERILKNQTCQQESRNLPALEGNQRNIRTRAQTLRERMDGDGKEAAGDRRQAAGEEEEQEQTESTQQTPSQRAMQGALQRMKQAGEKLKQAEKEGAIQEQEEAIAELQKLKEELEKILRQLREEELMQTLEKLESRFKRMLQQEQTIRSQTEKLIQETEADKRQTIIRADRLGGDQQAIIEDAEAALLLLREDGTAQAMVESLLQARFDMTEVKKRLEQTLLDAVTLHIEDAIIDALQEMLEAVKKAIGEAKKRQENAQNQQQQQGGAGEEPLIQIIAELRMIRSMQRRVNERTIRYDDEIKQALEQPDADLSPFKQAVEELARQQNRISRILHELKIGRVN